MTVMTVEDFYSNNWKLNFEAAEKQLLETGAKLLVIDSWGKFANFSQNEDEYRSGPTQERVNRLRELISVTGATVLIIHHSGKQDRNLIDAGLGATALAAQVDQAFSLTGEPEKERSLSRNMPRISTCLTSNASSNPRLRQDIKRSGRRTLLGSARFNCASEISVVSMRQTS